MSIGTAAPSQRTLDLAKPLAERQLARLERLADIGLELAEMALARAKAAPAEEDLSRAMKTYDRVARAVRLTDMLQTRIVIDLDRQLREAAHRVEQAETQAQREAEDWRKAQVERSVERLAKARHPHDSDEVDRLVADCGERLDYEDHGWLLGRPTAEVLADICRDLELPLDWDILQDMGWVKEDAASGQGRGGATESPLPLDGGEVGSGGDGSAVMTPEDDNRLSAATPTGHPHSQPFSHQGRWEEARPPPSSLFEGM